ncbi:DUF6456 domain-containing protein [Sulfitobacter sp. HNIBRBA3233]|uniref:DUF6456 domain-containing protein n=1 Tax=Sulfitobacter marinivivus TaxID=3158558 RepID=UPI0032DE47FD
MPAWVPKSVRNYLGHTEMGIPIRVLARDQDCHASTILRQIRRVETLRDDPLVDGMLRSLGRAAEAPETKSAFAPAPAAGQDLPDAGTLSGEALRVLRRLCERGAVLAVAAEMEKAVIVRDDQDGQSTRTAVVDRTIAEALALKGWIAADRPARITRYAITAAGRAALSDLVAQAGQPQPPGEDDTTPGPGRVRYSLAESPLAALARRRDRGGEPFLAASLVRAGERLREDFELAGLGPRLAQVWDLFIENPSADILPEPPAKGTAAARAQTAVMAALADLGPGLSDVTLRCCCYLEGLETAEKRLGWSARSGKIVLRIALMRLQRHYDERRAEGSAMIG